MFIPVGLIARLVVGSAQDSRDRQMAAAMERASIEHDRANHEACAQELWTACTGPSGCLLIVGNNDWSACAVDGIPIQLPPSRSPVEATSTYRDQADVLGPPPHGLLAVCPGRHVLAIQWRGRTVTTTVALYPREAYFLKFDADAGAFVRYERSEEQAIMRRASTGDLTLADYSQFVAMARVRAMSAKGSWQALPQCLAELEAVRQAIVSNQTDVAVRQAQRAGAIITGVALASFEPITTFVGFHVFELAKDNPKAAWTMLQAGLAILPDNPTLLAVQGELQLRAGAREAGVVNLERALARSDGLDPALHDRVKALLQPA
jgi:hypothetical protein